MDGKLLEKAKFIFAGVFRIWRRPARSWNSSVGKFCHPDVKKLTRDKAADRGQYRQVAGAGAEIHKGKEKAAPLEVAKVQLIELCLVRRFSLLRMFLVVNQPTVGVLFLV